MQRDDRRVQKRSENEKKESDSVFSFSLFRQEILNHAPLLSSILVLAFPKSALRKLNVSHLTRIHYRRKFPPNRESL